MKINRLLVALSVFCLALPMGVQADVSHDIRTALTEVEGHALDGQLDEIGLLTAFEVGEQHDIREPSVAYAPLVQVMSNNWEVVMTNVMAYATSRVERILIQNTGCYMSEEVYLSYLEVLTDRAARGENECAELASFLKGSWVNHPVSSVVYRRYQDESVSNLISRIQTLGVVTNWCGDVLSGRALRRYNFDLMNRVIE